jgi:tetratricopeptide (TPR) repeat protein
MRALRSSIAVLTALAILAGPVAPRALAEGDELALARKHFAAGEALFEQGRYAEAMAEFAQADAIIPSPINSYNIALCHDRLGDVPAAVREYRAYLDALPEAPNRLEVEARIAALRAELTGEGGPAGGPRERAIDEPEAEPRVTDEDDAYTAPPPEPRERASDEARPPQGWGAPAAGEGPARGYEPAPPVERGRSEKPIYKSWWFWGVAGVSALILLNIATASSSDTGAASLELPPPSGGMTIWRF